MEATNELSPRLSSMVAHRERNEDLHVEAFELEPSREMSPSGRHIHSMNALEILRETVRILRYNSSGFMSIAALLICPLSAVILSNVLVNESIVKRLTIRLLFVAKTSGLPLTQFVKHSCQKLAEVAVLAVFSFPLYITLSLLSKVAVVYTVDCTYSRKHFDLLNFYVIVSKFWKRIVETYLWVCGVIAGCLTMFIVLLVAVSSAFSVMGFPADMILYPAIVAGLIFSIIFANAIVICNIAIVVSVLEDVSGPQALVRSSSLIKGQTQVGLMIFLGSTIGLAFVEGLFEHRVKTLSYGDGSSRIWEGPLLVMMYSFVVLIDSMMSSVFYFSCKSYRMETANAELQSVLEAMAVNPEETDVS